MIYCRRFSVSRSKYAYPEKANPSEKGTESNGSSKERQPGCRRIDFRQLGFFMGVCATGLKI
jgi:hypothetical protein